MLKDSFAVEYRGSGSYKTYFEIPNLCPHCGEKMSPRYCYGLSRQTYNSSDKNATVGLLLQCVSCEKYFARMFLLNQLNDSGARQEIELSYNPPIDANIPEKINTISKDFPEIYMQALKAKQANLKQIYGMGLRKALEFLVKDFGIYLHPESAEDIKKRQLGYVIDNYFKEFADITALFKAATWIGNDETHYERKHPDKDAETINRFISVTMSQISSRLTLDEAVTMIEESAKPETKS